MELLGIQKDYNRMIKLECPINLLLALLHSLIIFYHTTRDHEKMVNIFVFLTLILVINVTHNPGSDKLLDQPG